MSIRPITIKDVKNDLGLWIKTLRKQQNLSQEELALALNLSRLTIQNLESGKNPTIDTLLKVLQHFDVLERFSMFIGDETKNNNYDSLY